MAAKILLVSSPQRRSELLGLLEAKELEVHLAPNYQEASHKLNGPAAFDLLFVDVELADGSWRDVLQANLDSKRPCEILVCSRHGDERLWAEVLQCGAYDLITEPLEKQEVLRIVHSALDSQYMRRFSQLRAF